MSLFTAAFGLAAEYPKAILSNGQIWIQASVSDFAVQATHDGIEKSEPMISPNGKLILYGVRESSGSERLLPLNLVFLDWSGKEVRRISEVMMKELGSSCGYGYAEWLDDDHIGVRCEYNPSLQDYVVLNADSGKVEQEYPGLLFSWSPDRRTLAQVGFIVHFAPPSSQNNCILFNGKPVYTPGCSNQLEPDIKRTQGRRGTQEEPAHYKNIHEINSSLVWSPDGRTLAFYETIYDFDWGVDAKREETMDRKNYRYFVGLVSAGHPAVGYQLAEPADWTVRIKWLNNSQLHLSGDKPIDRTFDLIANPPKPIP